MPLEPGSSLGPYSVTAKIGEGGMGEVYQARDTKLDRNVALKVLPEAFTADPDRLARFEREAKVLASLNHPNIGSIYGLEEAAGTKALVLELVEGPTLADRITQGPIPIDEALPIAKQIAEALEAAHEQGVIHRDLKPANVKVKDDGTVKVLDFGLAKAFQAEPGSDPSESPTMTAAATRAGVILGTAAYMSPEQAKGKTADRRSDIWAFGCVLYEMLTGTRPFGGANVSEVLAEVIKSEPNWETLPTGISPIFATFLRRCLVKDPRQRLHDVADLRLAMEGGFETTAPVAGGNPIPTWQRPSAVALIAIGAAAVTGMAVWSLTRPEAGPSEVTRLTLTSPDLAFDGTRPSLAISPDGRQVVYKSRPPGEGSRLVVRPIGQLDGTHLDPVTDNGPFFSPDGEWLGFSGSAPFTLYKVSMRGGTPLELAQLPAVIPLGASWGVDDQIIVGSNAGLLRVSADTGETESLTTVDAQRGEITHAWPFIIPDREAVLFVITTGPPLSTGQLAVFSLATGEMTPLGLAGVSPRYLSTGHLVYVTETGSISAVGFDTTALAVTGTPVPVVEGVSLQPTGAAQFSVSDHGRLVYGIDIEAERSLVWVHRDGREEPIAAPPRAYHTASLSPDGTQVALGIDDQQWDIWVLDIAAGRLRRLTVNAADDSYGHWTSDGQRVLFTSTRAGTRALYSRAADATGSAERITAIARGMTSATPDGARLIFHAGVPGRGGDLFTLSMLEDRERKSLLSTESNELNAVLSPDGRWLAYSSDASGRDEIYVRSFPDLEAVERRQVTTEGGGKPLWAPDGRELYYVSGTRLMGVMTRTDGDFSFGTPEVVFDSYRMNGGGRNYDIGPDGRFLMIKEHDQAAAPGQIVVVGNWFEELKELVPIP